MGFQMLNLDDDTPPSNDVQKGNNRPIEPRATGGATNSANSTDRVIAGVRLDCQALRSGVYEVKIPPTHAIRKGQGQVPPLSRLVGFPLRLRKDPEKFADWGNKMACWMMLTLDVDDPMWGFAPPEWQVDINNVVVVREDGKDLTTGQVWHFHAFCGNFLDKVEAAAEQGTRTARQRAMAFLTPQNYEKKLRQY